jgi:hypothetical protein
MPSTSASGVRAEIVKGYRAKRDQGRAASRRKPYRAVFDNELGNRITVAVRNAKLDDGSRGVSIRLTGPDSENENLVTPREAQELSKALHAYLQPAPSVA